MFKRFAAAFLALSLIFTVNAYAFDCSAASAIVMDAVTSEILYQKNANEKRSIASTTKIMTALLACESGRLNETVQITFDMVNTFGTLLGLRENDKITLRDLVKGMLLPSGNDAANATALFLGGSFEGFAQMMNSRAAQLGMNNSLFVTPSGLDEGNHHSTAYDMALLASAAMNNKNFAEICAEKSSEVVINGKKQTIYNHNKLLLKLDDCVGIKTGYTDKAGRCLVSAVTRGGTTLVCVTLNDADDWNDHINLYSSCFDMYYTVKVSEDLLLPLVGAADNIVKVRYSKTFSILDDENITIKIFALPFVYAPVRKGDVLGRAVIMYKEKEIAACDIVAVKDVEYYGEQV